MKNFNFNNSTKSTISRRLSVFTCVILFGILFAGNAWGQAKVTIESEISKSGSLSFEVWGVDDASVSATPVERVSPNGEQLYCAYDIDITKDGREWQPEPEQPAIVTMDGTNFADGQLVDIYHEGANGPEFVATVAAENGKVVFPAHSFSVYLVTAAGDYARLRVNFHRASGPDVTIYVKRADIAQGFYETILYNPGLGTPADGVYCMGWMDNELYDTVDISYALSFEDIRTKISNMLDEGVTDGDALDLYAMLFKSCSVKYLDENDAVIHTDVLYYRANADAVRLDYTVNAAYTPGDNTHNFEGWKYKSATYGNHIDEHSDDNYTYRNGTVIVITGDVFFDVHVSEGHWLIYHENGKGATFKAADFVRSGETTIEPDRERMKRNGYTFQGWFLSDPAPANAGDEPNGDQFVFRQPLTENTHVYAKWQARATAPYTIIIWKQNVVCDTCYDFEQAISLTGDVNRSINTVSQQGSGVNAYARVNGTNMQYTGFHLRDFDEGVTVNTEGNAILNVYYDRNQYTLTFQDHPYTATTSTNGTQYGLVDGQYVQLSKSGGRWYYNATEYTGTRYTQGTNWSTIKEIVALYGQPIGENFPIYGSNGAIYNNGERWDPQSTPNNVNDIIVYIDIMPNKNETYNLNVADRELKTMNYFIEALPDETEIVSAPNTLYDYNNNTISSGDRHFILYKRIDARYRWVTKAEDFFEIAGYQRLGVDKAEVSINNGSDYGYCYSSTDQECTVNFYYTRKQYTINFMDGAYYDGNNNLLTEGVTPLGQLGTVNNISYNADISSYNDYTPANAPTGYVFEGWFTDDRCTHPYTFTTMKEGGITVYAKWRTIQYRVFLHPNADEVDDLDWGSDEQEMNFRINYGGTVSVPTGVGEDYEFTGWYSNYGCTLPFNETLVLDGTGATDYDKTVYFTDDMDKWGNGATYNKDLNNNRFWITQKYDIYGKWRAKLRGANGINVVYVDSDRTTTVSTDAFMYLDNVHAIAGHALSSSDADMEFSHWVLQNYDGSNFVDTDIQILPGATFTVRKDNAQRVIRCWYNTSTGDSIVSSSETNPNPALYNEYRANYTVKLRAVYEAVEKPKFTSIDWYDNYGGSTSDTDLPINETVTPPVPSRPGYNFKGWYKYSEGGTLPETIDDCDPHFLYYKSSNGAFYEESSFTNVATIAADLHEPIDYMYAIWEPIVDFTFGSMCPGDRVELPTRNSAGADLPGDWTASVGSFDGDYYIASNENATLYFAPDSRTCASDTSYTITVKLPYLLNASDYDYIWKGNNNTADWNTASNWYVYDNGYSIATEVPSIEKDIFIGPATQCVTPNWPEQNGNADAHNLTIAAGASLTVPLDRTLNIAGNLENIGTLNASEGKVIFCGPADGGNQTISHDITFGNVIFYNQGGDIIPAGNVTINGAANFKDGVVKHDVTFGEDASVTDPDGMSYSSFVEGKVTKSGSAIGFTFPTGKDNVLGKIAATSDAENVSVQYFRNSAGFTQAEMPRWWNINDMCSNNNPQLDHVSNVEYWKVSTPLAIEAVLTVSAASGTAHFNANTATHDADDIYGAFWSGSCWENIGGGSQSVSADPYGTISVAVKIPQTRAVYEKIVTLGSKDHNTILPIELTSFSATCDGRSSHVMWTTATEKNNDYFSLERSDDAINFVEIARIAGAGNSIEPLSYSYTDYGVYGGDNYYRLVQVDYDGTRTASEIIVTNCVEASGEPEVLAYPNPFNSDLTVELENFGDRPASIEVYDVLGRLVYVEKADAPQNSYQTVLHLDGLSNSTYTVRVSTSDFVINQKVVKN
ncbi:MAG: InlB B-repeat-containing protein [Bacteroidales bacterium]|nr:InlB B-repeat-containing protein [Bacteroidales bacterium]